GSQPGSRAPPATDWFDATVPYFSGSVYSHLQGMNPAASLLLTFDAYTPEAGINNPVTFVEISRVSDGLKVFSTSGPNSMTSVLLPPGTLQPTTAYDIDVAYSSRIDVQNAGFAAATSQIGFDRRTDLTFTTAAVPEPPAFALVASLAATLAVMMRLRRGRARGI